MSYLDILRKGVAIANAQTRNLQATVSYQRKTSTDAYGTGVYATAVSLHAIVDFRSQQVRTREGVVTTCRAVIDLLDIDEVVTATGGVGVVEEDLFTLPDGSTGPVLALAGFIDAGTTKRIATTVMLG